MDGMRVGYAGSGMEWEFDEECETNGMFQLHDSCPRPELL